MERSVSDFPWVILTIFLMSLNMSMDGFKQEYEAKFSVLKTEYAQMQETLNIVAYEALKVTEKKKCIK